VTAVIPVLADIDPYERRFTISPAIELLEALQSSFGIQAYTLSPGQGYSAIGAGVVAAVLYFKGRTGMERETSGIKGKGISRRITQKSARTQVSAAYFQS
jgi:hypothetical protein